MSRHPFAAALFATSLLTAYAPALDASACGGTFCDLGPAGTPTMPVDQRGENILFVMRDGWVEAHVQILYTGDPDKFAWIVPVMTVPEISAGSDPLFANLLASTVPTFTLDTRFEPCDDRGGGIACMAFAPGRDASAGFGDEGGAEPPGTPDVVARGVAGAFEYAVLDGGTVDGVVRWLDDNGYAQEDEAPSILAEYLDEGFVFVAFKLLGGTGIDEIHPVVIRYQGTEPCVPIRLTRVAAEPDMGIRVFFLDRHRVVPTNFRHVEINPLLIDWPRLGANYEEVVTLAVDAPGSDGHGFVTEYAGPSDIVPTAGIHRWSWDAERFLGIDPTVVVAELRAQGLVTCDSETCVYEHPLVRGLLARYLPRPVGVTEENFYACLSCYAELIDLEAWSDEGFAQALAERIIEPAKHAVDLLDELPYLTRMYTTLSPHEMTKDPFFHANPDLPDVDKDFRATRVFNCEGPDFIELDDGRRIALDPANGRPETMPWAGRIEEIPERGAPMTVNDLEDEIEDARRDWNHLQGLDDDSGCSCRSSRRRWDGALWLGLSFGFAWLASRRRRPTA